MLFRVGGSAWVYETSYEISHCDRIRSGAARFLNEGIFMIVLYEINQTQNPLFSNDT